MARRGRGVRQNALSVREYGCARAYRLERASQELQNDATVLRAFDCIRVCHGRAAADGAVAPMTKAGSVSPGILETALLWRVRHGDLHRRWSTLSGENLRLALVPQ